MTRLENLIHSEIEKVGPMTFARFLEMALYHPEWGYYAREEASKNIGRRGDFFTSVSVGSLFGRLLARQFADWWQSSGRPSPFHLMECGGLDGRLAGDILLALERESADCFCALKYVLVEPLPRLQQLQQETLSKYSQVSWVDSVDRLESVQGIIFVNELLDAFPFQVYEQRDDGCWEWKVGSNGKSFCWTLGPQNPPSPLSAVSTASYRGKFEICSQHVVWLEKVSRVLRKGRILLLDYGWTDEEYFQISRPEGTLRGYRNHQLAEDVLADPGEQDLTAHVRWTPILKMTGLLGLTAEEFIQQGRWLTRLVAEHQMELNAQEVRQFQTLTHSEMMGSPFRVLVLAKGEQGAPMTTIDYRMRACL